MTPEAKCGNLLSNRAHRHNRADPDANAAEITRHWESHGDDSTCRFATFDRKNARSENAVEMDNRC